MESDEVTALRQENAFLRQQIADSSTAAPPEPSGATSSPDWLPVVKTGAEVPLAADRTAAMDARETEAAMS